MNAIDEAKNAGTSQRPSAFTAVLARRLKRTGAGGNRSPRPPFYIDVKRPDDRIAGLLFTVFLRMSLACMLSVIASVGGVTVGAVSMMRRFLVMPALVVFSCLSMVPRSF